MLFAVLLLTAFLLIEKKEIHKPEVNQGLQFANLSPLPRYTTKSIDPGGFRGIHWSVWTYLLIPMDTDLSGG